MPSLQTLEADPPRIREDDRSRRERERQQRVIQLLLEKSSEGKLNWRQTADEHTFITAVGETQTAEVGRWDDGYVLVIRDESGRRLLDLEELAPHATETGDPRLILRYELERLYRMTSRSARDVVGDEEAAIAALESL